MEVCKKILKSRRTMLLAGTMLAAMAPVSPTLAADVPVVVAPAEPVGWYFWGGMEAGGRIVLQQPPSGFGRAPPPINWLTQKTTDSRAKFEEYGDIPSGVFLDWINLNGGTFDGRFAYDLWARNVGLNNQSYSIDVARPGEQYFWFAWDQTPHLISTSAKTVFGGVGTDLLTVDPALRRILQANLPNAALNTAAGTTARTNIENAINNAERNINLSTQRDRLTTGYRGTPTPDIDYSVEYSNEHRTGTRPTGVPYGWGTTASPRPTNPVEVVQPLDDRTQSLEAKGEYVGVTPWNTAWSGNVRYNGSVFTNDVKQLDVQNPFCITCNVLTGVSASPPNINNFGPNMLRLGLYPDNNANAITGNFAFDLPFWKSRNVTTVQYNSMRQNDPFITSGTNGLATPNVTTLAGVPVGSLNGEVNTLLLNNLYTAQITNDVKMTIKARHYDVQNDTPSLHIATWIFGDSGCAAGPPNPVTGVCSPTDARNSLPISYIKDNVSAEMSWRPVRWATVGGGWFFERWDRDFRDVNITNENTGRVFVDLTPTEYVHARGSYQYGERRYNTYNTEVFVEEPALQFSEVASNMRRFDIANRNRQKGDFQVDLTPGRIVTVSPTAGFRWDDYPDPVFNPLGVSKDHSWNVGVEVAAVLDPSFRITGAYNYEDRQLNVAGGSGANFNSGSVLTGCSTNAAINPDAIIGTACTWRSDIDQHYHTFMVAADWKPNPSVFDVRFEALYVVASEGNATTPCSAPNFVGATAVGTNCNGLQSIGTTLVDPALVNFGQFPTERNNFLRFNAVGRYYVDPSFVKQMGWNGDVVFKVRYTWERNTNTNWGSENTTPYIPTSDTNELTGGNRSLLLAAFNPNYTAQVIAASVVLKW